MAGNVDLTPMNYIQCLVNWPIWFGTYMYYRLSSAVHISHTGSTWMSKFRSKTIRTCGLGASPPTNVIYFGANYPHFPHLGINNMI